MDRDETWGEYAAIADLYDHVTLYRERADVPFYVEEATACGGAVLEAGCGTGRVLVPIARAGVEIVGLDASEAMLGVCRERLAAEPAEVRSRARLVSGDMRIFDLGRAFRLATTPFRAFQHLLTVKDQVACLDCLRRHLEPGGRLILDVFNPSLELLVRDDLGVEFAEEPPFVAPDGRRVVRRARITARDRARQVQNVELLYDVTHPDGRRERIVQAAAMRWFFRYEAEHLLARCGFEVEAVHGGYDRSAFGSREPGELIVIARRTR